jgi:UDP-GlcNAc:undecaprenyl-phosphate GlcNAc-1-phosphate transferase
MTPAALLRHLLFCAGLAGLSAAIVRLMIGARLLDRPDHRKAHDRPTPKGGGVGIVAAFLVGIGTLYAFASFARLADGYFIGLIAASCAIAAVAFLDDLRDFPFTIKLAAQLLAAAAAVASGLFVRVYNLPWVGPVDIGWLGAVPTLAWIVFATNALNFIDGLNGLASGVVLIACGFLAGIGASQGGWFVYFASLLLGAGVAGFLPFNFPRARIFMGDVGSQFCGFVLAMLGVAASRFESVPLSFVLVPMLLFGVLYDVAFTLARRLLAGENVTRPHRGHLYQIAHRAGMDARAITLVHWGFAAFGGLCCLAFLHADPHRKPLIVALPLVPQLAWSWYVWRLARTSFSEEKEAKRLSLPTKVRQPNSSG